ncbi:MAG: FeGP cofactor biosynthesis protein HcgF family protein [Desulfurobacteriaceae bacterium]
MLENRTLTFVSLECFTHCEIGMEVHKKSAPYVKNRWNISVVFSAFAPSISIIEKLLGVKLPKPKKEINNIKIYDEKGDIEVCAILSERLLQLFGSDIVVVSSAGEGRGCVIVKFKGKTFVIHSDFEVKNFEKAEEKEIRMRKNSAKEKTLKLLENLLR